MSKIQKSLICLIDDDETILEMYRLKFEIDGYRVLCAQNGADGLALIKKQKPDLVLLDIVMPDLDGFQVLKRLKAKEETRQIPVILLTNLDSPEDRRTGCELGALYFLPKAEYLPKDVANLAREILAVAQEKRRKKICK